MKPMAFCTAALVALLSLTISAQHPDPTETIRLISGEADTVAAENPEGHPMPVTFLCPGATEPLTWFRLRSLSVRLAFRLSGGWKRYGKTLEDPGMAPDIRLYEAVVPFRFDFSSTPPGILNCEYTSLDSVADAATMAMTRATPSRLEKSWVNYLCGNFITGKGPENILFPIDGQVSHFLRNSVIIRKAFAAYFSWMQNDEGQVHATRSHFRMVNVLNVLHKPISVQHFVASADILITPVSDSLLYVAVYNVTSITSADFTRHLTRPATWIKSMPRGHDPHPYANTSQIFQLTFTTAEARQLALKRTFGR